MSRVWCASAFLAVACLCLPCAQAEERVVRTQHSVEVEGVKIAYTAEAGEMLLRDEMGKEKASLFFVAYFREGVKELGHRPIAFCTNGGPGSSSVWLHLGMLGPRRVVLEGGDRAALPYRYENNGLSLLDEMDLVFIDPVATGYSRPEKGEELQQFHGVEEDVAWVGEFIRQFLTRYDRWMSPKIFVGASYGAARGALLLERLHDREYLYFDGLFLISPLIHSQVLSFLEGNDLAFALAIPSYAAVAWSHKKLSSEWMQDRERTLHAARAFALGEYAQALQQGDALAREQYEAVVKQLSDFTGLSPEYIQRAHLRIDPWHFAKELLRSERLLTGRFDGRVTGIDLDLLGEAARRDPSLESVKGVFTAAIHHYLRDELKWETDQRYTTLMFDRQTGWNYSSVSNRYLNVTEDLREVVSRNPNLRVFVANGLYDLAVPYLALDYTLGHLCLDPSLKDHLVHKSYEAGHMVYLSGTVLEQLRKDFLLFLKAVPAYSEAPAKALSKKGRRKASNAD